MCSIDLVKPPKKIFRSSVDVVSSRVIWEVIAERRPSKLLPEQIDLVQEEDDTRPHEPSRVDYGIEKY